MTTTAKLYDAFWTSFMTSELLPSELLGHPKGFVHRGAGKPTPYLDFSKRYPFGFRPTAVISARDDHLRAQLSCERAGRDIAEKLGQLRPSRGASCDPYLHYFSSASNGKVELVWQGASVRDPNMWPYHHTWLIRSMELIVTLIVPALRELESNEL